MWKCSFVATAVALGETVDGALVALGPSEGDDGAAVPPVHGPEMDALLTGLRAESQKARAAALANAVRAIIVSIDEATLL